MESKQSEKDSPAKPPSLWNRFDAAERERRLDEFVAAEQEKPKAEWAQLPSIKDRDATCGRCGQGKTKHTIATAEGTSVCFEVNIRESDGQPLLYSYPYIGSSYSYGWQYSSPPTPIRLYTLEMPMTLTVTCECGNTTSYRPLDAL